MSGDGNRKKETSETVVTVTVTGSKKRWFVFGAVTLAAAGVLSYFASPHPDGLERVAEDNGFLDRAETPGWTAWIPDYELPGVESPWLKVGLAGVIGAALLFAALYGLGAWSSRKKEAGHGEDGRHPS